MDADKDLDPEVLYNRLRAALRRMEVFALEFNRDQQWDVFQVDSSGAKVKLLHSGFHRDIADTVAANHFVADTSSQYGMFRHNSTKPETLYARYPTRSSQ